MHPRGRADDPPRPRPADGGRPRGPGIGVRIRRRPRPRPESRTWPLDPEDERAADGDPPRPGNDSFDQIAGLWGRVYDGPPLGRERFDGSATLTQVTDSTIGFTISPDVSRDGRMLVFASDQHGSAPDIYVRRVDGSTITRITHDAARDWMPTFSPDGSEIAFASNREGTFDIYVVPTAGGPPTRLTHHEDDALHPTFSPDGRRIAYCRLNSRTERWEIWMVDRENGRETLLHYGMFPEWNPDPARPSIVFQQARARGARYYGVWTIDLIDGEASAPTEIASAANYACMHPTWSPDGTRIAFIAVPEQELGGERPGLADVWIIGVDGRERRQLTLGGSFNMQPAWSRDGTIYFTSDRSGTDNVWALRDPATVVAGAPERLSTADPETAAVDASSGGSR